MLLPDMTVLLYTAVVYRYRCLVTLLLFFYQHPPGLQYQNKSLPIPCVRLRKSSSSNLCCVLLRFSSRGLKTTSFLSMCQHYRALKTHEPLDSSLSRHKYHPLRPSRDFILPSPTRTYALPKGRTTTRMSVNQKFEVTSLCSPAASLFLTSKRQCIAIMSSTIIPLRLLHHSTSLRYKSYSFRPSECCLLRSLTHWFGNPILTRANRDDCESKNFETLANVLACPSARWTDLRKRTLRRHE